MPELSVTAKLGLDGKGFEAGLNRIKGQIAAAFSIGAIAAFSKEVIEFGSNIKDMSQRLGISTDSVQELGYAARQSGADIDQVAVGLEKIAKAQEEIRSGSSAGQRFVQIFNNLGISVEEILANDPEQIFRKLATALTDANTAGQTQAQLLELMGKGAGKLISVMKGLNENVARLHKSGGIITPEEVEMLDKAGDKLEDIKTGLKIFGSKLLTNPVAFLELFDVTRGVKGQQDSDAYGTSPVISQDAARQQAIRNKQNTDQRAAQAKQELADIAFKQQSAGAVDAFQDAFKLSGAKGPNHAQRDIATDSLVSVGNFLGKQGRGTIESIAQKQVQLLTSIDKNIARIALFGPLMGFEANTPN